MSDYQAGVQRVENHVSVGKTVTMDVPFPKTSGLYVGVSGDVVVQMSNDEVITFKNLASGVIHPISCISIVNTGTTATNILAVY